MPPVLARGHWWASPRPQAPHTCTAGVQARVQTRRRPSSHHHRRAYSHLALAFAGSPVAIHQRLLLAVYRGVKLRHLKKEKWADIAVKGASPSGLPPRVSRRTPLRAPEGPRSREAWGAACRSSGWPTRPERPQVPWLQQTPALLFYKLN